ncbi:D123-domain-containing protein [Mycena floridula]|nr:D123-domain-containing protein [Mycena floridula]
MTAFPPQTRSYILAFQFGSWYPKFSSISIKSKTITPLSKQFRDYLDADSIFVPEGSEDVPAESSLSDDEDDEPDSPTAPKFAFPELDEQIRACVKEYGAVFPKLNFSSPKDASWVLAAGSPLKCTSPADVYLLLKSSDFVNHDLSIDTVFDGCEPEESEVQYDLQLVLRKWYEIDRSRELRCFVRQHRLLGISQRDTNYYDFLNDSETKTSILTAVMEFWENKIREKWDANEDYVFDILLTRDLSRAHVVDFNPYSPRTDPLLFTYEELLEIFLGPVDTPAEFRVIDSRAHALANSNAPAHQHNMIPFEALSIGNGRSIDEFADQWRDGLLDAMQ